MIREDDTQLLAISTLKTEESQFNNELGLFTSHEPNEQDFTLEIHSSGSSIQESLTIKTSEAKNSRHIKNLVKLNHIL